MNQHLLRADRLSVRIGSPPIEAVRDVTFEIQPGEILGLAGESGSGKSVTALALTGLLPPSSNPQYTGHVSLAEEKKDLLQMGSSQLRSIRGKRIAYVFQEPSSSFNPVFSIEEHLREILHLAGTSAEGADKAIADTLQNVGLTPSRDNLRAYPGDFSGGMLQRLAIACALINKPDLLIADEPTTALDTTTQLNIVQLLQRLNQALGMSILFISHDLALLKQIAPRMLVMQKGRIVEQGNSTTLLRQPEHPYTRSLVAAIPRLNIPTALNSNADQL